MAAPRIGWLGLGRMGAPMVANLLKAGHAVRGHDPGPGAGAALAESAGFTRTDDPGAVADGTQTVVLMLPDSSAVDAVLWGPAALGARMAPGATLVDMGSSHPMRSRANAQRLAERGVRFVDAPVSGGVKKAVAGTLAIIAGGEADAVEAVRPLLAATGDKIIHVGPAGAGHAVKALNNYVSAAGLVAVCEALIAARAFGIDPQVVNQVFNVSTGRNNTTEHKVEPYMLSGRYDSGFALALMRKDVGTAVDFIDELAVPSTLAHTCLEVARAAEQALGPQADHTHLYAFVGGSRHT